MSAASNPFKVDFRSPQAVVVGEGWAALSCVALLALRSFKEWNQAGSEAKTLPGIVWVSGTGSRILSAHPGMEEGQGMNLWTQLAAEFGIAVGDPKVGSWVREFRNKAFREPTWMKAPNAEARLDVKNEILWEAERPLMPIFESRWESMTLNEFDARLREIFTSDQNLEVSQWKALRALVKKIDGVPVAHVSENGGAISLASGEEIACSVILYADRWASLLQIAGLPKEAGLARGRFPVSLIQATLKHSPAVGQGTQEAFYGILNRESGEEHDRHVWGHFASDGSQSYWTLCLSADEIEDNHQIAKKLRKMKNSLDRMFSGESWLPPGCTDLMSTVKGELVRFSEADLFTRGEPVTEPSRIGRLEGVAFLTDGYGPGYAIQQAVSALGLRSDFWSQSQTENVDATDSVEIQNISGSPEGVTAGHKVINENH